jgi:hypothetical protein
VSPDVSTDVFHRWPALLSTGGSTLLMFIALPVFSSFSLDESQWDRDEGISSFASPWIITAVSTPRLRTPSR